MRQAWSRTFPSVFVPVVHAWRLLATTCRVHHFARTTLSGTTLGPVAHLVPLGPSMSHVSGVAPRTGRPSLVGGAVVLDGLVASAMVGSARHDVLYADPNPTLWPSTTHGPLPAPLSAPESRPDQRLQARPPTPSPRRLQPRPRSSGCAAYEPHHHRLP